MERDVSRNRLGEIAKNRERQRMRKEKEEISRGERGGRGVTVRRRKKTGLEGRASGGVDSWPSC